MAPLMLQHISGRHASAQLCLCSLATLQACGLPWQTPAVACTDQVCIPQFHTEREESRSAKRARRADQSPGAADQPVDSELNTPEGSPSSSTIWEHGLEVHLAPNPPLLFLQTFTGAHTQRQTLNDAAFHQCVLHGSATLCFQLSPRIRSQPGCRQTSLTP